jgi:hypothetical protein
VPAESNQLSGSLPASWAAMRQLQVRYAWQYIAQRWVLHRDGFAVTVTVTPSGAGACCGPAVVQHLGRQAPNMQKWKETIQLRDKRHALGTLNSGDYVGLQVLDVRGMCGVCGALPFTQSASAPPDVLVGIGSCWSPACRPLCSAWAGAGPGVCAGSRTCLRCSFHPKSHTIGSTPPACSGAPGPVWLLFGVPLRRRQLRQQPAPRLPGPGGHHRRSVLLSVHSTSIVSSTGFVRSVL